MAKTKVKQETHYLDVEEETTPCGLAWYVCTVADDWAKVTCKRCKQSRKKESDAAQENC